MSDVASDRRVPALFVSDQRPCFCKSKLISPLSESDRGEIWLGFGRRAVPMPCSRLLGFGGGAVPMPCSSFRSLDVASDVVNNKVFDVGLLCRTLCRMLGPYPNT